MVHASMMQIYLEKALEKSGVIWITGFSSSGKTTVGRKAEILLRKKSVNTIFLDGMIFAQFLMVDGDMKEMIVSNWLVFILGCVVIWPRKVIV